MIRERNRSDSLIECLHLGKSFGKRMVLRDISFNLQGGNILTLVGPNGAGKTTLLKILATLITPDTGGASVAGADLIRNQRAVRRSIGFVSSEERSFYWRLTGRENLRFFAALHGVHGKKALARIDSLLEAVGLEAQGASRFREYSTGMKQALGIARAMLHDPPVLLLDEPTRSLGPDLARKVRRFLLDLAKQEGKAILWASQNLNELEELADQAGILHQGAIRAIGSIPALQQQAGLSPSATPGALFDHFTGWV